jgi:hypothetical protein
LHGDPEERKLGAVKKQTSKQAEVRALADLMGVPLRRLSKAAGGDATIARTLELLRGFYPNPEHLRIWLRTPHPDLGGETALDVILAGNARALVILLRNAENGIPA